MTRSSSRSSLYETRGDAAGGRGAGVPVVRRGAGRVGERAAAAGADSGGPGRGAGAAQVTVPGVPVDAVSARVVARPWQLSSEALAVMEKFPPRQVPAVWDTT